MVEQGLRFDSTHVDHDDVGFDGRQVDMEAWQLRQTHRESSCPLMVGK